MTTETTDTAAATRPPRGSASTPPRTRPAGAIAGRPMGWTAWTMLIRARSATC